METIIGLIDFISDNKSNDDAMDITVKNKTVIIKYPKHIYRIKSPVLIKSCVDEFVLKMVKAVWDTGATNSCIDINLAKELKLQPIDIGIAVITTGKAEMPYYIVDVQLTPQIKIPHVKVVLGLRNSLLKNFLILMFKWYHVNKLEWIQ